MNDEYEEFDEIVFEAGTPLDQTVEYLCKIVDVKRQHPIFRGDYKGMQWRDLTKLEREDLSPDEHGQTLDLMIAIGFDIGMESRIKMQLNLPKRGVGQFFDDDPERDSKLITFRRKLGYSPKPKEHVKLEDLFKVGTIFKAHIKPQDKNPRFSEINLDTVRMVGTPPSSSPTNQSAVPGILSEAVKDQIRSAISECETKQEAIRVITGNPRLSGYLTDLMTMIDAGETHITG